MKITRAQVKNFRILKELDIDFEDELSVIIGKNNTGKTSFLSILHKFLSEGKPEFAFEDFSVETQRSIIDCEGTSKTPEEYSELSLSLKLYISYEATDDLGDASALLLDLDRDKSHLVVLFEYALEYEKYRKLVSDYNEYQAKGIDRDFLYYVSNRVNRYFTIRIKALEYENESNFIPINSDTVKSVISMQTIGAKRDVDNEQGRGKSLSSLAGKYYEASAPSESEFPDLQRKLAETDDGLTKIYQGLFEPIVKEIAEMSYSPQEAKLSILSTLSEKKIFQDNTTVKYKHENMYLPEDYNGLGYLNLFAMIFNLRIKLDHLAKKNKPDKSPTPLNLLFIEEPEAHTHPQMQYVFIKNIKRILKQEKGFSLQTVISTHSSHIVSQCEFQDIKYFYRESTTSVKSRSLKNLHSKIVRSEDRRLKEEQERSYRFVKQYVTLDRAELFFADKAILIEGTTERIFLPAMMKKIDDEKAASKTGHEPLLSQNISMVEVGAYAHVFATFLGFLDIKTLLLTDLDCVKPGENDRLIKCKFVEGTETSNASIKYFTESSELKALTTEPPITLRYNTTTAKWDRDEKGQLRLLFQKEENGYQASSFEDAFLCINRKFITDNKGSFKSLKNTDKLEKEAFSDSYDIANKHIESKTSFALDVLLHSGEENKEWTIPFYIKEGLLWLARR